MKKTATVLMEARKTPVQARSAVTVEAIFEAAVQVLLKEGTERLTTTRVAERAGVSIGTLYQYFPNKQSLLYAVLELHLLEVLASLEQACAQLHHQPLARMADAVVQAFVDAKLRRADASAALYAIASDLQSAALLKRLSKRVVAAISAMLCTASDGSFVEVQAVAAMLYAAMAGATRATLEAGASVKMVRALREQLVLLCGAYLRAANRNETAHAAAPPVAF